MRHIARDVRHSFRRLRASPGFSVFAVVTLALGIGVTTAMYSILRAVCAPPSGVRDVHAVMNVYDPSGGRAGVFSWPDYEDLKVRQTVFEALTAVQFFSQPIVANGRAETVWNEIVDGDYFGTLGVNPVLGRALLPADDQLGAPPVAVISQNFWQRVFDSAPDVIGRTVSVSGHDIQVVGVVPDTFHGLNVNGFLPSTLWVPLSTARLFPSLRDRIDRSDRQRRGLLVKGRLRRDRTLSEAQAEMAGLGSQRDPGGPASDATRRYSVRRADTIIMNEALNNFMPYLLGTLAVAVGLVLLVACTNLANLILARASGRQHEVAVRLALGASRRRLIGEALAEMGLLAIAGGAAGLGVARVLLVALGADVTIGTTALHIAPVIDGVVLLGTAGAVLLALAVVGLMPALQSTRADVRSALCADGGNAAVPRWRGRRRLIAAQAVVSVLILAVAAVCLDHVRHDTGNSTGVDLDKLALVQVDFGTQGVERTAAREIVDRVLGQVGRQPNVDAVAASSGLPVAMQPPQAVLSRVDGTGESQVELLASTPELLRTLGIRVIRGRALDGRDTAAGQPVLIVSEHLAQTTFGTVDAVGRRVLFSSTKETRQPLMIVGVAANTNSASRATAGAAYLPLAQHYESRLVLSARTSGDPAALVGTMRQILKAVAPQVAVGESGTGLRVAGPNPMVRATAKIAGLLGGFALLLVLTGLYGVLSQIVILRTREVGVRLALGANASQIIRMVLVDGVRPVVFGVGIGATLGIIARMAMRPLFDKLMPTFDPFVLGAAPVGMLLATIAACYLPARRAAQVDPNVALRQS